jgi:hypothetical protein
LRSGRPRLWPQRPRPAAPRVARGDAQTSLAQSWRKKMWHTRSERRPSGYAGSRQGDSGRRAEPSEATERLTPYRHMPLAPSRDAVGLVVVAASS